EPATHRNLAIWPVAHHEVHELGHAGVGRAARALVFGDHEIGQEPYRFPLVRCEERGRERGLRFCGLAHQPPRMRDVMRRPLERRRQRREADCTECLPAGQVILPARSLFHRALFLSWSAMYSDVRHDSAMIVQVGFLSACEVKGAPSVTNRFFTSCVWQLLFTTEVFGSAPMRAPPSS